MQRRTSSPRTPSRWRAAGWLGCALAAVAVLGARAGLAATLSAIPQSLEITPGQMTEIDIVLDLGPGEEASVFEGRFDLVGVGSVVESLGPGDLLAGGSTWESSFGGIVGSQIVLSLTSSNAGGSRLVGRLVVRGLSFGLFEIRLASGTFVQRDIAGPPFVEDVPIATPVGAVLTSVSVNPAPPQVPALGPLPGLVLAAALALCGRRSRASRLLPRP